MASPDGDDTTAGNSPVLAVLRDPTNGQYRLPYLLSLVEDDDVETRLRASCALCLVGERYPELADYVVRRLIDRLGDDAPTTVAHTLDYFAAEYPREVDEVLVDLEEEAEVRARRRMYRTGGGFARSDYMGPGTPGGGGERARARVPSGAKSDPRRAYVDDSRDETAPDEEAGTSEESESDRAEETAESDPDVEDIRDGTLTRGRVSVLNDRLSAIVENSRFDSLDVVAARRSRRFGDVYRTLGSVGGEEAAVGLIVFRLPDESAREAFVDDFRAEFEAWTRIDDHDNVHTVYDWGWHPRPWAAVEYAGLRLPDRGRLSVTGALDDACALAGAVANAHQRGIVHGGIDPGNVAYVGDPLEEDGHGVPLLTNVGLLGVYRWYFDPDEFLDPRYAAPEYFDDSYGTVDHLTDVYQLGMVVYRLATGRPPFAGEFETVRRMVLERQPRPPSQVADGVPPALDRIVAKATAKGKLSRYDTVDHFQQELCRLRERLDVDGS